MSDSDSETSESEFEMGDFESPIGEGTPWRDLSDLQQLLIITQVERTFKPSDRDMDDNALERIRYDLYAFIADKCRRFPVILQNIGSDIALLAYSQNPLRQDQDDGSDWRCKFTHHHQAMTAEEQAIAYHQGATYLSDPTLSYSDLVLNGTLSPATARRLDRFRPHSRVPMAQLARMPADAAETKSPTMSPEYEAPQLDMYSPRSPLAGIEMSPPTQVRKQSPQRPEPALERGAQEWEDGMKQSEATKAKELESIEKLLKGLPDDAQVSADNFYDWLHEVDIPYDAAIDELPGKQLTTGEGQQVQVPEYDGRRHGGREFHKQARITGRIRAEVRDETRNVDFTDRRRARGLSPVPAGTRVAHNQWQPKVQSQQAVENAVTDRHYRASSEPIGNRDLRQLRPFYPNLIPPQAEPLPYKQHPEPSDTDDQRRRKESKARKEEAKSRKSPRDESKVKKSKRSPK
ncbi:hypothetical protein HDE_06440 [Halotydeus destructor]|nr:hypothetical protein HDE_06440 [Halotydeus destructor]